jgi:hypothetical protein
MTLKEYIENLNEFVKENPEALEYEVVTSADDEGNYYNPVHYTPSMGLFEDGEFTHQDNFEECEIDNEDANAVCIN